MKAPDKAGDKGPALPDLEPASAITPGSSIVASPPTPEPAVQEAAAPPEPQAIAQAGPKTDPRLDPYKTQLPITVGSIDVRKAFKLFAREELIRNLSFRDTPVREVIAEIARRGNLNILIDKSVVGRVTGDLHDVTLNEAMDNVLAASGLQSRVLDNNTVVIGTPAAMTTLGLNRTKAKAFKLSYAHPYDVAQLLYTGVFNKGMVPDFQATMRRRIATTNKGDNLSAIQNQLNSELKTTGEGGARKVNQNIEKRDNNSQDSEENLSVDEANQTSRLDVVRTVRGTTRAQVQEGVGFNNASIDPGSQSIRLAQETPADYPVENNNGGALAIPDVKNRQVIVIGTAEDIAVAEETIRLIDRRPKQVHIQASLIELTNQAIRQLGASLQTQGGGASGFVLGQQAAGVVNLIPGQQLAQVGPVQPNVQSTIAGVTSNLVAQSLFNLLSLNRDAGGRINMATFPGAINVTVSEILETKKAKLVASPTVVVVDNTEALITLANEVIHKITTTSNLGVTTTNVELTKAGIFLNVLPKITQDGFITMRLRPQISTPLGAPQQFGQGANLVVVTLLSIREIMSQEVRIKDGQTLVLGGLFTENEAANLAKLPYIAEAPILGALFRNSLKGRNRTELLLMLTPKIVEEEPPPMLSGTGNPQM